MQEFHDRILYKTHQHFVMIVIKSISASIPCIVLFFLLSFFVPDFTVLLVLILSAIFIGIIGIYYFFWIKSYFIITNEKIVVKVRNGLFSKFHMSIYFKNIRDAAYSKNHLLHYVFDCGTVFLRSSAGAVGDLEAKNIPHIEEVYKIVNYLYNLPEEERKSLENLDKILQPSSLENKGDLHVETQNIASLPSETLEQAAEKEKNILLEIQGIKEVIELSDSDRRYIFEHEEDRNHGVYECLRRQVLFAATHDSTFREPDEAIVMQAGEKVVFPVIQFHEIQRKKISSSSPGMKVHEYLAAKFEKLGDYDATLLIGFDV